MSQKYILLSLLPFNVHLCISRSTLATAARRHLSPSNRGFEGKGWRRTIKIRFPDPPLPPSFQPGLIPFPLSMMRCSLQELISKLSKSVRTSWCHITKNKNQYHSNFPFFVAICKVLYCISWWWGNKERKEVPPNEIITERLSLLLFLSFNVLLSGSKGA